MKRNKLKLEELKLESFVTTNDKSTMNTIKAGAEASAYFQCGTITPPSQNCPPSYYCTHTCPVSYDGCGGGTGYSQICENVSRTCQMN